MRGRATASGAERTTERSGSAELVVNDILLHKCYVDDSTRNRVCGSWCCSPASCWRWVLPVCKPGSVECRHSDGHSSRGAVTRTFEQPTRSVFVGAGRPSLPIWPCSRWGLPCRIRHRLRGGLLPHRFTLACTPKRSHRRSVLCCTVRRCLATSPRRYLAARPVEPGLSSNAHALATIRPAASARKIISSSARCPQRGRSARAEHA